MRAYQPEVALEPFVLYGDRITKAVERMVSTGSKQIAVVKNNKTIGMIRLEDAFAVLGLHSSPG